jgi:hypoxanthine phosphoribosyltransferase
MEIEVSGKPMVAKVLLSEDSIQKRTAELAKRINEDYPGDEPVVVLVVLHGALLFAADLVRGLTVPTLIESTRLRSYSGTTSTGTIELVTPVPKAVEGNHVLVVEDIVDSGHSLGFLLPKLRDANPKSIRVAALLDKPEAHEHDVQVDYVGFSIGRNFVIGYGLDLDGRFRNLPYIAELVAK